jgi:hypothetical protein
MTPKTGNFAMRISARGSGGGGKEDPPQVDNIPHSLVAVATLFDAGCSVYFYF